MADRLSKFRNQSKKGSNKYVGKRNDNKGLNKEGKLFDKVRTYKWETDLKDGNVAEGDTIPLSKATHGPNKEHQVEWNKYRRAVSVEAIARHGASKAIDQADARIMRQIQHRIRTQFVDVLDLSTAEGWGEGIQKALAASWGRLATFEEFNGSETVSFVNPMDVATY